MPTFTVTGEIDPFLHVSLRKGELIFCESGAMVMMESGLRIKGQLRGGVGRALLRRLATDESLFQQEIEAVADGDCLLSPALPGAIELLTVTPASTYCLADGSFLAAENGVEIRARLNSVGGSLFGGTGGFVIMEASGRGQLAISGFGALFTLDVVPERDTIIDNHHVVAWSSQLHHEIGMPNSGSGGMFGGLLHSMTSGEGLVIRFRGRGKVVVCSRNRALFRPQSTTG